MTQHDSLDQLKKALRSFAAERDWDQFHTPPNLAAALGIEVAELQELFLWATPAELPELISAKRTKLSEEIGDVLLYLVRLADKVGIDPVEAAQRKLALNARKYPVGKARGSHKKYTEF